MNRWGQLMKSCKHNLPAQPTPFVGRESEMAEIASLLDNHYCRLLTLFGPGGIGKTRLAVETAAQQANVYADGIFFVPLQGVRSPDLLVASIADALQMGLRNQTEPHTQLLGQLGERHMLLVLDNLEHLLVEPGADLTVDLLRDIVHTAPDVMLLVTSREVLNMQEEWVFPVHGLPVPQSRQAGDEQGSAAVVLFAQRAQQASPDFSLDDEQAAVVRICQLVEGIPLALELAASWKRMLTCSAIADKLEQSLRFAATTRRDVPARHRSMQAVFEQSWTLLAEKDQTIFRRLSIFRNGFRLEAAEAVCDATLPLLAALVDKSLLQPQPGGRYQMHEFFRQFAEAYLLESPAEMERIRQEHCAYYCAFLHVRRHTCTGPNQRQVIQELQEEIENIRPAWQHAVLHAKAMEIRQAAYALYEFFDFRGRYRESVDLFQQAVQALEGAASEQETCLALAEVLDYLGASHMRLGQLRQSREASQRSLELYARLHAIHPPGFGSDPRTVLSIVACIEGDYAEAVRLGEEAQRIAEDGNDQDNQAVACYVLANALLGQRNYAGRPPGCSQGARSDQEQQSLVCRLLSERTRRDRRGAWRLS